MFRLLRILVEIPALDRLLAFLEAAEQTEVDALTDQLKAARESLTKINNSLKKKVQENQ